MKIPIQVNASGVNNTIINVDLPSEDNLWLLSYGTRLRGGGPKRLIISMWFYENSSPIMHPHILDTSTMCPWGVPKEYPMHDRQKKK